MSGLDNSGVVRYPVTDDYQRWIAGLKKVHAIVKEMSDDEAIINMVDANIQREEILPSERAFSLK